MSNKSRIPSPSRSISAKITPRRRLQRISGSQSVGSPARPLRLSTVVQRFKNDEVSSPNLSNNKSVLSDNTDILQPRRRSWWKSTSVMSMMENDENHDVNHAIEEIAEEVISQGEKYDTLDLPESSDSESIASIVIPERNLFAKKKIAPKKFPRVSSSRILQKTLDNERTIALKATPKKLFKKTLKRTRPPFPDALLDMTTIANRTSGDKTIEVKAPLRTLLNNRGTKRKNMFQNFIAAESDEDIPEVQPKVFGFQKTGQPLNSNLNEAQSPSSSIASDLDGHWNLLPSSTMMEGYGFERETPSKKARVSKLSNVRNLTLKNKFDIDLINEENLEVVIEKQAMSENRKSINIVNRSLRETSIAKPNKSKVIENESNQLEIDKQLQSNEVIQRSRRMESSENSSINNTVKEKSKQNISQNKSTSKIGNNSKLSSQSLSRKSKENVPTSIQHDKSEVPENMIMDDVEEKNLHAQNMEIIGDIDEEKQAEVDALDCEDGNIEIETSLLQNEDEVENKGAMDPEESEKEYIEQDVETDNKENDESVLEEQESVVEDDEEEVERSEDDADDKEEVDNMNDDQEDSVVNDDNEEDEAEENREIGGEHLELDVELEVPDENREQDYEQEVLNENIEQDEQKVETHDEQEAPDENINHEDSAMADDNEQIEIPGITNMNEDEEAEEETNIAEGMEVSAENNQSGGEEENDVDDNDADQNDESAEVADDSNETNESADVEPGITNLNEDEEDEEENNLGEGMEVSAENNQSGGEEENDVDDDNDADQNDESAEVADDSNEINESADVDDQDEEAEEENLELSNDNNEMEGSTEFVDQDDKVEESEEVANDKDELEASVDPSREEEEDNDQNQSAEVEQEESENEDHNESEGIHEHEESAEVHEESEDAHEDSSDVHEESAEVHEESSDVHEESADVHEETDQNEANDISFDNRAEYSIDANSSVNATEQNTLLSFLEKIKQNNLAKQEKIRENFRESLKPSVRPINNNLQFYQRVSKPRKTTIHVPPEFKPKKRVKAKFSVETLAALPKGFYEDLKYRPPKRYTPPNTSWATKRLYTFLENKLEPKYDYMARIRAEKFVTKLFEFSKHIKKLDAAPQDYIQKLQYKMASLNIIETYCDFYDFFRNYLPKEIRIKVIPDIMNKLPLPPRGIHSRVLPENEASLN